VIVQNKQTFDIVPLKQELIKILNRVSDGNMDPLFQSLYSLLT